MTTNIISFLHTTLAYQSAALHLMVGQANFTAQQLHLAETLPIVIPASTNDWSVAMPPYGVTGRLFTSNYVYQFKAGKLVLIQNRNLAHTGAKNSAYAQPSLIDTNGAYQLATQWLAAISVDVPALEKEHPHTTIQPGSRPPPDHRRNAGPASGNRPLKAATNVINTPVFNVIWGSPRNRQAAPQMKPAGPLTIEILGSTRQCIGLHIPDPALLRGPALEVTNAAALLGTPPSPQQFVAEFLGGKAAYDCVAQPDKVTAWRVSRLPDNPDSTDDRTAAVAVNTSAAGQFSKILTDFNSYDWLQENACTPALGVRLRFARGAETVEVLWWHDCDHIQVTHNGQTLEKDCAAARALLVRACQFIFPADSVIKNLPLASPSE